MPIAIYFQDKPEPRGERIYLCAEEYELPGQIYALESWLQEKKTNMKRGRKIVDVGFQVRKDASGGGAVISPEMMRTMADLEISLFLSEYPS